jgi:hypothetical protein
MTALKRLLRRRALFDHEATFMSRRKLISLVTFELKNRNFKLPSKMRCSSPFGSPSVYRIGKVTCSMPRKNDRKINKSSYLAAHSSRAQPLELDRSLAADYQHPCYGERVAQVTDLS